MPNTLHNNRARLDHGRLAVRLLALGFCTSAFSLKAADEIVSCKPVPDHAALQHCISPKHGMSIDLPGNMAVTAEEDETVNAADEDSMTVAYFFGKRIGPDEKKITLDQFITMMKNQQFAGVENATLGEASALTIDGLPGRQLEFTGVTGGTRMKMRMVVLLGGDRMLFALAGAPETVYQENAEKIRGWLGSIRQVPFPAVIAANAGEYEMFADSQERFWIKAPKGWHRSSNNKHAVIEITNAEDSSLILLIAEHKADVAKKTLADYAKFVIAASKAKMTDIHESEPVAVKAGVYNMTRYAMTGTVNETTVFAYQMNFFEDDDYYYQIMTLTRPSLVKEFQPLFEAALASFKRFEIKTK